MALKWPNFVRAELQSKVDLWKAEAENRTGGRMLAYDMPRGEREGGGEKGTTVESAFIGQGLERWEAVHLPELAAGSRANREAHHG